MNAYVAAPRDASFGEFLRDPTLTVACVLLIVVSLGWVIVSRLIVRRIRRTAKARAPSQQRRRR